MDSKIENYLLDVEEYLDTKTYNQMFADADKLDTKAWLNKYQASQQANDVLAATWNSYVFDTYSKDKYERYRDTFGSSDSENPFNKPESWLKAKWTSDYPDMSFEDFKNDIATMSKHWEGEKRAREYEAGKTRRTNEVKNWPLWRDILASDYEKQRYINDPKAAIFGKEATPFKEDYLNKGEALSDLIYGGAGAVGDVLPGWGVLAGPAIRTARDVQHKATDSPYQKEWTNVVQDAATDALFNMGTDFLPNLRRFTNMGKRGSKESPISTVMRLEDDINSVRTQLKDLGKAYDSKSNIQLIKTINEMPEGDFKNELLKYASDYKNIDKQGIATVANKWQSKLNAYDTTPFIDVAKNAVEGKSTYHGSGEIFEDPLFKRKLLEPKLTRGQTAAKNVIRGVEVAAEKGGPAIKLIDTAKGRGSEPTTSDSLIKDWYKQNYKRDWLLEKPFKPAKKEGDPKWEAYAELRKEYGLEL